MKRNWILLLLFLFLAGLIVYRSHSIPITHDESGTWFFWRHTNLWKCFFDTSCWNSANNHWLNTLLLQWSANIFGESPWVLRLPNVLAGVGYLVAAVLLVTRYLKNFVAQIAGFVMLSFHLFLLDFFSLARGYGLMSCGVMWGIFSLLRYSEQFQLRWFAVCVISMSLAMLANFTSLIPYAAIMGTWFSLLIANKRYPLLWKHGYVLAIAGVILSILLYIPLRTLSGNGEFLWGADNVMKMGVDLVNNLVAGKIYFTWFSPLHILYILLVLFLISLIFVLIRKQTPFRSQAMVALACVLNVVIFIVLVDWVTGAKAPIGRKSIFLIPFFFTALTFGLNAVKGKIFTCVVSGLSIALILYNFFSHLHPVMKSSREWYYDAYYPELFAEILPDGAKSDSISLGATWTFIPALIFYQKTESLPISGLKYDKQIVIDTSMQYYYLDPSDFPAMDSMPYEAGKWIGPFRLYKRK